jgi:hypothetical protein
MWLLGIWNPGRGIWERGTADFFSGLSEPYSETWPISGMTRDGVAFELPMPELLTDGSGSSSSPLLRTPIAQEDGGGPLHPDVARANRQSLRLTGQILAHTGHLPTPRASDWKGGADPAQRPEHQDTISTRVTRHLLPTPTSNLDAAGADFGRYERSQSGDDLTTAIARTLLPTPTVGNATGGNARRGGARSEELLLPGIAAALFPTPTTEPTTGNGHARNLGSEARMLPTPTAMDSEASGGSSPIDVTLTDAVVRTQLGHRPNPRHTPKRGGRTPSPSSDGSD